MGCMNQIDDNAMSCPHCGFNESTYKQESYYLTPGNIVGGKYIVGKVMKYGGHTVSYIGMDAELNRKVIIKEYLPSDFSTRSEGENEITIYSGDAQTQFENGLTSFLNEANIMQGLGEPEGIAAVYDCLAENDTGYVISEYVQGQSLQDILSSRKKYSVNEAKTIIVKLLKGLSKVHAQNIIHCDISPETIMIDDSGEVKLVDFGATRYVTTSNSKSLAIILKQGYAAEEQYRSNGRRGPWTDVYAVAAVMYRMITGVNPQESVERALLDELKTPSKLGVSIDENIENALMNALNVFKNERTPDAKTFLQELNSSSVKRIKPQKKSNDTSKFPIWAKALVAGLFCIAIIGGVFLLINRNKSSEREDDELYWTEINEESLYNDKNFTKEVFDEYLKDKGHNIDGIKIEYVTVYNKDPDKNGIIKSCDLTFDRYKEAQYNKEKQEEYGITIDNNHITSGNIKCYIYSSEEIRYEELADLNAYSLSKKLPWEQEIKDERFVRKTEDVGDNNYFDIEQIELLEGPTVTSDNIKNDDGSILVNNIKSISYYAGDFFYWPALPNFEGSNIEDYNNTQEKVTGITLYNKKDETSDPEPTDNVKDIKDNKNLYDDNYFSFLWAKGYVFEQLIDENTKLDTSEGLEEPFLKVIGSDKFNEYKKDTAEQLTDKIKNYGLDTSIISYKVYGNENAEGEMDRNVMDVKIIKDGKEVDYAKKDDEKIQIVIYTQPKPAEPTRNTNIRKSTESDDWHPKQ